MSVGYDAVVVGSGPNGLAAAVYLAEQGASVCVLEAAEEVGGGTRSGATTLPNFIHDKCSAVHPMAVLSPYLKRLPLEAHGLRWCYPEISVAHPLADGKAALLRRSIEASAASLDEDETAWIKVVAPFVKVGESLFDDVLGPPMRIPAHKLAMLRLLWLGIRPASRLARSLFRGESARALFAGCAAHSILPLSHWLTGAVGLVFSVSAHLKPWPCAEGGSASIARALKSYFESLGGRVECGRRVDRWEDLPAARVVLFDTAPRHLAMIARDQLPASYRKRLGRYRYGPAVFKLDWALSGSIGWTNPEVRRASTVHVGGTLEEIESSEAGMWKGEVTANPFVIMCQQSELDPTRAPAGKQTGYAYCHVPAGCTVDMTDAIERQIERFAPGFRDLILHRTTTSPADLERSNANYIGGAITGGIADLRQFVARPVLRRDPYRTPNPRVFLCSGSTPPGGGVHGMCGYYAARSAWRVLERGRSAKSVRDEAATG